jgi:hypothetical protein
MRSRSVRTVGQSHAPSVHLALLTTLCLACTAEVSGTSARNGGSAGAAGTQGQAAAPGAGAAGTAGMNTAGTAASPSSGGAGNAPGGGSGGTGTVETDPQSAGPLPLRHLTSREYRNSVRDLVFEEGLAEDDVPNETSDPTFEFFPFRRPGSVGVIEAETLRAAAEAVARNLAGNSARILPCSPESAGEASCAQAFIADFGRRAYRRPLDAAETAALTALYDRARGELALDFDGAIGLLVEAVLQSPGFYYHFEREPGPATFDATTGVVALGPYQLASRLSYFLWGTLPDAALFAAAESGALSDETALEAEVRRMLADTRARGMVADFFDDLLDLDVLVTRAKDTQEYPAYDASLQAAMRTEVARFTERAVFEAPGTFAALLTSTRTSLNGPLAELYGVTGIQGEDFADAELPSAERGGLLTLSAFLANSAAAAGSLPPRRGKFVYTRILCEDLPPPPPDVPAPAEAEPGLSTRQRFEAHGLNPCAAGCHVILDGLGFAFENYDGVGAHRTVDMNVPVDASGEFAFDGVTPTTYQNAIELGQVLAAEPSARACFAKQWLRYAFRREETAGDAHSLIGVRSAFDASDGNVIELLVALAKSRTFRFRASATGEVLP